MRVYRIFHLYIMGILVYFFLNLGLFFSDGGLALGQSSTSKPESKPTHRPDATARTSYHFQKPIVHFLGFSTGNVEISPETSAQALETTLRFYTDLPRFISLKIPKGANLQDFVRKMVAIVAKKSLGIARMRAEWDTQFQGYTITSTLLEAIQNNAFFYWLTLKNFKLLKQVDKEGKASYFCVAKVKLHLHKLTIFDCSSESQAISPRHKAACQGKSAGSFAGFSSKYQTLEEEVSENSILKIYLSGKADAIHSTFRSIGQFLAKKMREIKEFTLVSPVSRATFNDVHFLLGRSEGLKLNHGFYVYELRTDGKRNYKGYVKTRSIGDNVMKMVDGRRVRENPTAPYFSRGENIIVHGGLSFKKGMVLEELPLVGTSFGAYGGLLPLNFKNFGALGLRLTNEWDISDATKLNEFYISTALDISMANFSEGLYVLFLHTGVLWKLHIRQLVLAVGARVGASYLFYTDTNDNETKGAFNSFGGEIFGSVEIFISPRFSLSARLGFRLHATILESSLFQQMGEGTFGPWLMIGGFYTL